jgi:hypothetical protein
LQTPIETILTFGLSSAETTLVKRLVASFEIDTVALTIGTVRNYVKNNPKKKICLVIYHVNADHPQQDRVIQLIRDFVGDIVPFLILVPREKPGDIRKLLQAGADDYIELPLNEDRFSISFLILLEMGQALPKPYEKRPVVAVDREIPVEPDGWSRVVDYIQDGLSYFAPKSLIRRVRPENISDRWQRLRRLGIGGFGTVWLVKEIGSGRIAVAKTPHSPALNISVLRSAAILKRLVHHPNVVHLIEVTKDSGRFILIQEYVAGPTLQHLLGKGIPALDKESYFLQLLSVISYAHKHKILHRDIKPENIIITATGRLKLLDFGIARDLSWQTADSSSAGTVNFMPPEQFEGRSCIASDVWALGVILYIFATNAVPYCQLNDHYPMDIETTVESRAPRTINPNLDLAMDRIIMRCLQKDLDRRYPNATELQTDLQTHFPQFGMGRLLPD